MKKTLSSLFLLFLFTHSSAQVFPLQGSLQVIPPYTPYLTDYTAIGEQKLILQLRPNDNTLGDHPVRLRLSIEGFGITIRTKANYIPPSPHTLMGGGSPTILYSADLSNYFNPDNLDFAGFSRSDFQRSGKLPEGMYQFSFEVLDYYRQVALSSKIMTVVWIVLNDPPMLNLPFNNTKITHIDPTNIAFNWTPRHTASPNSAFSTEYVFRLVEVWSASRNAYDAFLSQPVLFEKTLTESQLIYGPSEPALSPGHTYAWQIQARDEEKKDVFKNQGKSEVFVFQFGDLLGVPENLRIAASGDRALNLEWEPAARGETPEHYNVRYKAVSAERWKETLTEKQWVILEGLQPNTDYQAQVRGKLKDVYSDYTPLLRAKTNEKAPDPPCGEPPPVIVPVTDKTSRIPQLNPGDVITCDDWRIVVLEATRSANGEYAGLGMMAVNMFNGASIEVKFQGAVNVSYQMVTGGFESTYEKGSEIGSVAEEMKKIGEKKKSAAPIDTTTSTPITVPGIIDSVYFDKEKKEVVVIDKEGKKTTYPQKINPKTKEAKPMQITDSAGNTVTVGKDGTLTKGAKAGGAGETSGNTTASIDPQINILIKEILASFSKDIDDYLARKPPIKKGPSADLYDEYFEKPDCLPDDADALRKIRTYSNKLQKNTKQMEQFVEGILQKEENRTYFNNLLKNSLDGYKQKKTYKETLSTEDYNKVCETICPYLVEGAEKPAGKPLEAIVNNEAGNYMTPDKRLINLPAGAEIFYNCENESYFQNTGYLYKFRADNKIWQAIGSEHSGSGFKFEKYTSGGEQYTIGTPAKEGDEVWQVTQTFIQSQRRLTIQKRKLTHTTYGNIFEKSEELSEEKSISVTTPCENKTETARTIENSQYKIKVSFEKNKWQAEVTLKGNPKNETVRQQKAAIEAEMNREIAEKLNELGGLDAKRSKAVTAQSTEDGGEFWVKDMNGLEWLHTIGNLGSSVWETAALPKKYWDQDEGYQSSTVHCPPTFAGVGDGVVEEVTEYPQLIKLGYDVATKPEVREGLWNLVKNISLESIKNAAVNFYEERKGKYTSNKPYIVCHTVAKDAVAVVGIILGVKAIKSVLKNVREGVEKTGKEIFRKVDDDLIEGIDGLDGLSKRKIKESIDKGEISREVVEESKDEINDIAVKKGRKNSWEEIKALFKRGNDFNAKGKMKYKYNEINLANGKRLDSYIPDKEIISRKATTLAEIKPSTFEGYLKELTTKYKKGSAINAPKFNDEFTNQILKGEYFLEIPISNKVFFEGSDALQRLARKYNVNIKYLDE